jgi:stage II sporulation protein D
LFFAVALAVNVYLAGWFNVPAGLAQVPEKIRIGVVVAKNAANNTSDIRDAGAVTFSVQGEYEVIDSTAFPGLDVIGTPAAGETWQVLYLTTGIQVMKNGESQKITTGPVVVREKAHGSGNLVTLNSYTPSGGSDKAINRKYRGNIEFRATAGGVVAVNELPLEEYLYGVVAKEMSKGWPLEALKAQAVTARSYTAVNINKHLNDGFNLCSGTHCQAYGGHNVEAADVNSAVDATKGEVMVLPGENKPLSAVYHSNSGGHTENNENVWSGNPVSYLRGKPDPYSLKNGPGNWTFTTTINEVSAKLSQYDAKFTQLLSLTLEKYPSGRVRKVMATDINGYTVTRTGSEFGKMFNPGFAPVKDKDGKYVSFISNFFDFTIVGEAGPEITVLNGAGQKSTLKEIGGVMAISFDRTIGILNGNSSTYYIQNADGLFTENKFPTGQITFNGHGWGHGVGMSQWGAYQMAKEGKTYKEILTFYYTGVEVRSI